MSLATLLSQRDTVSFINRVYGKEELQPILAGISKVTDDPKQLVEAIDYFNDVQTLIEDNTADTFFAILAHHCGNVRDTIDCLQDNFHGIWYSEIAYAEQLFDDCYDTKDIPEPFVQYFDMESWARDLFISDYYSVEIPSTLLFMANGKEIRSTKYAVFSH